MGHSYCHIWIHLILVTKHPKAFIDREINSHGFKPMAIENETSKNHFNGFHYLN